MIFTPSPLLKFPRSIVLRSLIGWTPLAALHCINYYPDRQSGTSILGLKTVTVFIFGFVPRPTGEMMTLPDSAVSLEGLYPPHTRHHGAADKTSASSLALKLVVPASEMTYIVSGGALNSTHLFPTI